MVSQDLAGEQSTEGANLDVAPFST
jgi:hypothetical protein